jgi:hypothetical protein
MAAVAMAFVEAVILLIPELYAHALPVGPHLLTVPNEIVL